MRRQIGWTTAQADYAVAVFSGIKTCWKGRPLFAETGERPRLEYIPIKICGNCTPLPSAVPAVSLIYWIYKTSCQCHPHNDNLSAMVDYTVRINKELGIIYRICGNTYGLSAVKGAGNSRIKSRPILTGIALCKVIGGTACSNYHFQICYVQESRGRYAPSMRTTKGYRHRI